jgi:hypothetical protein
MSARQRLPNRRSSEQFTFTCDGLDYIATISFFHDGQLAEIFLNNVKADSHSDSSARDSAVVCSLALQQGVPLQTIKNALLRNAQDQASSPLGEALDRISDPRSNDSKHGPPARSRVMNINEILLRNARNRNSRESESRGRPFPAKHGDVEMRDDEKKLPAVEHDFDVNGQTDRLIQGTILRCVDGHWSDRDGVSFSTGTQMLVLGTTQAVQHWQDGVPVETILERPLPDVQLLNESVPEGQWEAGLDGDPRPPYVLQHVAYLLDPRDASLYTYLNSTKGAEIAVERLTQKVKSMRLLRGQKVSPVVKLDSKPMPTKFGQKMRPEFVIVDWRDLSGGGGLENKPAPQLPPAKGTEQIGKPVKPVTTKEELNDEIGF